MGEEEARRHERRQGCPCRPGLGSQRAAWTPYEVLSRKERPGQPAAAFLAGRLPCHPAQPGRGTCRCGRPIQARGNAPQLALAGAPGPCLLGPAQHLPPGAHALASGLTSSDCSAWADMQSSGAPSSVNSCRRCTQRAAPTAALAIRLQYWCQERRCKRAGTAGGLLVAAQPHPPRRGGPHQGKCRRPKGRGGSWECTTAAGSVQRICGLCARGQRSLLARSPRPPGSSHPFRAAPRLQSHATAAAARVTTRGVNIAQGQL